MNGWVILVIILFGAIIGLSVALAILYDQLHNPEKNPVFGSDADYVGKVMDKISEKPEWVNKAVDKIKAKPEVWSGVLQAEEKSDVVNTESCKEFCPKCEAPLTGTTGTTGTTSGTTSATTPTSSTSTCPPPASIT